MYRHLVKTLLFAWSVGVLILPLVLVAQNTNLGDLLIRFCNDETQAEQWWTKDLFLETAPNQEEDICIFLVNGGNTDVTVKVNFVDGTITNDAEQKKACQPEWSKEQFGQYVTIEDTEFFLAANSTVETHAKLTMPQDAAGMVYGCMTLQIAGEWAESDEMIQVISRRANFIDVAVKGEVRPSLQIVNQSLPMGWILHNQDPRQYIISKPNTDELFQKIVVENDGNIAQYVSVQSVHKWIGKLQTEETVSKKILPQQTVDFLLPITSMPFWKWPGEFSTTVTYAPSVEDTFLPISDAQKKEQTVVLTTKAFFFPRTMVFVALWVLFFLLLLPVLKPKKKSE